MGKTTKVSEFIDEQIEFPRAQIVILEEVGNSLEEGQSLSGLVESILNVLPEAQIIMTLQVEWQLSQEDVQYANENFTVMRAVQRGVFVTA